ncbi:hypothetical protein [Nocardia wallacei]|uniref:hypothetical protein n=1 Tax=Nocardia wallacei TaxID=480035 RepID=UPI002455976D|nr:hypothetical protein [Nocardia wallacei]
MIGIELRVIDCLIVQLARVGDPVAHVLCVLEGSNQGNRDLQVSFLSATRKRRTANKNLLNCGNVQQVGAPGRTRKTWATGKRLVIVGVYQV